MLSKLSNEQEQIIQTVRVFVDREVIPVASELEHRDEYPAALVERMKELGIFGANIPEEYGGLDLDYVTYAAVFEELARGWLGLAGSAGTHSVMCDVLNRFGTVEQKQRYLPRLATGEIRGGLALSETDAGTDVQRLRTTAVRDGRRYILNGEKMWVTNGRRADVFATLVKTNPSADPPHTGMSAFLIEKGHPGFIVSRDVDKCGYKGVETCEFLFEDLPVPAENLIGGEEGHGFKHIMTGLESERINVASRAVGIARAAFEAAVKYSQHRITFGKPICEHQAVQMKLADMATRIEAARLLTYSAAEKKNRGERCDLEAGMAKLFATEMAQEVALDSMKVHGGVGYAKDLPIERYYRDAPLLIIGGGTNELQRILIAQGLVRKYAI